jgi:N-methylhydantoinase A
MVGVDVGGTFTDVVALDDGRIVTVKVPTNVRSSDVSVLAGAAEVGVDSAAVFNLASTAGLNAVITRRIPKVAMIATDGFRDTLAQGTQQRPVEHITNPGWRRSFGDAARPLIPRYLRRTVPERITATGEVFIPLDETQVRAELQVLRRCHVEGVAVCLMNAYVNGSHERRVRELVHEELGDVAVSVSCEVSPLAKEYYRASTTVIDVLMKLLYGDYTRRLDRGLADLGFKGSFNYADCRSTLLPADYAMRAPYSLVFGGPAAGTIASRHFGSLIGDPNLLCADVGGTSCDISAVIDGREWVNTSFDLEWDLVVNALSVDIISLGAGGGSIVAVSPSGDLMVGPDSAGADPGPACYNHGGDRPTVTDLALLMGILNPDGFLGGKMRLSTDLAEKAVAALDTPLALDDVVASAWKVGLNHVAEGIFDIAIRRGIDCRDFSLVAFGAAGPMMLPSLLDIVPLRRVIVPPSPGLFSALGLLSSDQVYSDQRSAYRLLSPDEANGIDLIYQEMEEGLLDRIGARREDIDLARSFDGYLEGQGNDTPFIPVPPGRIGVAEVEQMVSRFHEVYEQRYGKRFELFPVKAVTYRVELVVKSDKVAYPELPRRSSADRLATNTQTLRYVNGPDEPAAEVQRADLLCGDEITGPAIIREATSTTFVPTGRTALVGSYGELYIS